VLLAALLDALAPSLVVYHCVEGIAAQKGVDANSFRAVEARFLSRANLVLASSPTLVERLQASRRTSYTRRTWPTRHSSPRRSSLAPWTKHWRSLRGRGSSSRARSSRQSDMSLVVELARMRPA